MGSRGSDRTEKRARLDLRRQRLRATPCRLAVLIAVRRAAAPVSHMELCEELVPFGWDQATVYRNLVSLTERGLLHRVELGDHIWRYTAREASPGAVFSCTECGGVEHLSAIHYYALGTPWLPAAVREGLVDMHLRGVCDGCDATAPKDVTDAGRAS